MYIEQVALIVDDYNEAIRFFVDALGSEPVADSPSLTNDGRPKRWVVVRPHGATTAVLLAQADGERQVRAVGDQFAGRGRVDDTLRPTRTLAERGAGAHPPRYDITCLTRV
jgi:catechol 2,3-dioxygenase-like lactoylglutathione lyase family enzyme